MVANQQVDSCVPSVSFRVGVWFSSMERVRLWARFILVVFKLCEELVELVESEIDQ